MMRELIMGFVDDDWLHGLDYSSLESVSGQFVSEDLRLRNNDLLWRVRVGGDWLYLYLLLEFQSSVDRFMALRINAYLSLLYQDFIKQGVFARDGRLPPVLPIVLYNGTARWTAPLDLSELIPPLPGSLQRFVPRLEYS